MPFGLRELMQIGAATTTDDDAATSPRFGDEIAKVKKSRRSYERSRDFNFQNPISPKSNPSGWIVVYLWNLNKREMREYNLYSELASLKIQM